MTISYQFGLVISIVLMAVGMFVGTLALMQSIKEVRLLRKMGLEDLGEDEQVVGSPASSTAGAAIAGLGSATVVALYGVDGQFFYLGPIAALVSAAGVIACFIQDIVDEKRVERVYEQRAREAK